MSHHETFLRARDVQSLRNEVACVLEWRSCLGRAVEPMQPSSAAGDEVWGVAQSGCAAYHPPTPELDTPPLYTITVYSRVTRNLMRDPNTEYYVR